MPQPRIPEYWRDRIMALLAQIEQREEKPSDKRIRDVLLKEAEALEKDSSPQTRDLAERVPSERTISRIRKEKWPQLSEENRAQYREFYWPESMERGDLPWEASKVALDLLFMNQMALVGRPTIRHAKWLWQLSLAAPDATHEELFHALTMLSVWERLGERPWDQVRGIEWYLAYAPWRAEERSEAYDRVRKRTDEGRYEGHLFIEAVPPLPELEVSATTPLAALEEIFRPARIRRGFKRKGTDREERNG